MRVICTPCLPASLLACKKAFIVSSILHEELILNPFVGYVFLQKYPKLAQDSLSISTLREDKSIPDYIDRCLDIGFKIAMDAKMEYHKTKDIP